MLIYLVISWIYPFGDNTFLRHDLIHQYYPFLFELRRKLLNGESLFYSFHAGMGTNFYAIVGYYLVSPLNFFCVMVPEEYLSVYMLCLVLIKTSISALSMQIYISHHFDRDDILSVAAAICFSMSAYFVAYNWNIMWFDAIMVFPLIILGAEKLYFDNKITLYALALVYAISTNYYISIMICLFIVLWFLYMSATTYKGVRFFLNRLMTFAGISFICVLMCSIILIPEYEALKNTISAGVNELGEPKCYVSLGALLKRFLIVGEAPAVLNSKLPNIFCGTAAGVLIPAYLLNKEIPIKERIAKCLILLVIAVGFIFNYAEYIWHGLHYPHMLPARHSFLFIFLILIMAYEAAIKRNGLSVSNKKLITVFAFAWLIITEILNKDINIAPYVLTGIFVAFYILIFNLRKYDAGFIKRLVVIIVSFEMLTNLFVSRTDDTFPKKEELEDTALSARNLVNDNYDYSKPYEKVKWDEHVFLSDGMLLGAPSASIFASTSYSSLKDLYKAYGLLSSDNAYLINGATPLMDMLLSDRYKIVAKDEIEEDDKQWKLLEKNAAASIYENKYILPPYLFIESSYGDYSFNLNKDAIENQSELTKYLSNGKLRQTSYLTYTGADSFIVTKDLQGRCFIELTTEDIKTLGVTISGDGTEDKELLYYSTDKGYLVDLGCLALGDKVSFEIKKMVEGKEKPESVAFKAYTVDYESLDELKEIIDKNNADAGVRIKDWVDNKVHININNKASGSIHLLIPYDAGWKLYIDEAECVVQQDSLSFIKIPVEAGQHDIKLIYTPKGFLIGTVISTVSFLFLLMLIIENTRREIRCKKTRADGISLLFAN